MDQVIATANRILEEQAPRSYEDLDLDTNIAVHFHDPHEHELPSSKFGIWIFVAIFGAFLVFSGFLVYLILSCSRMQEKVKANVEESKW